jgi:putative isomerase
MKKIQLKVILILTIISLNTNAQIPDKNWEKYIPIIKKHMYENYKSIYREAGKAMKHPFLTPGSEQYADVLWDWDSWLTNVALRQILANVGTEKDKKEALKYEQGCILNFLEYGGMEGWMPISIQRQSPTRREMMDRLGAIYEHNMHKPCLAQHAAFLVKQENGDAEWLHEKFYYLQAFVNAYYNHYRDKPTGLFYWATDGAIGVDNDPCTFFRPDRSSASIYLNCLMVKELEAIIYLAEQLDMDEIAISYEKMLKETKEAIQEHLWDPKDGFFYSADLNMREYERPEHWWDNHPGGPPHWDCVIERIGVWSGFLALWAEVATTEQAERVVKENLLDTSTFNAPYGVRTLSKMEKMYDVRATGNPSNWLGPLWGPSQYMTWHGLVKYGFEKEARELAIKTVVLFGRDYEQNGALHEYYLPSNGLPVLNPGFQNWNFLVLNMIAWLEGGEFVAEF